MMNVVRLPCAIADSLDWRSLISDSLENILWEFDLGLDAPCFPLEDELRFHALKLSLTLFSKEIWPDYQSKTAGASLYRGSADFFKNFHWSEQQEENWEFWKKERLEGSEAHLRRLFCADAFAHYFQMLSHALPDELPLYLFLDGTKCGTRAEIFQLLSKERFEHFRVAARGIGEWGGLVWGGSGIQLPAPGNGMAVCFPEEIKCSGATLKKLDRLLEELPGPFRLIPEPFLTECWDEIDHLYVFSETVTFQVKRKLIGFCAAGGTVIVDGDPIGLSQEISVEEFRGRGI